MNNLTIPPALNATDIQAIKQVKEFHNLLFTNPTDGQLNLKTYQLTEEVIASMTLEGMALFGEWTERVIAKLDEMMKGVN